MTDQVQCLETVEVEGCTLFYGSHLYIILFFLYNFRIKKNDRFFFYTNKFRIGTLYYL